MSKSELYLTIPKKDKNILEGKTVNLHYCLANMQGWRTTMEDAHCVITNFGGDLSSSLFGIFDGHGGILAQFIEIK